MTTPQPPYGEPQPQGHPTYQPPPVYPAYQRPVPRRRRPSGWWFVLAGLVMVAGAAIGVLLVVQAVSGFLATDVSVDVDGRPHTVTVPAEGERMLWMDESATPTCVIVDLDTGEPVVLHEPTGTYTRSFGSRGEQVGQFVFDAGSGRLEVTCGPALSAVVEIGPAPQFGKFFGGLGAGIIIPIVVGGGGLVMLIVLVVLAATGRPRNVPAPQ